MLIRPTEPVVRGLILLATPQFDALRGWLEESRRQTVEMIADGDGGPVQARMQGEARGLKDLLTLIKDAPSIAQKMNQK
jgi:hypothetical protein